MRKITTVMMWATSTLVLSSLQAANSGKATRPIEKVAFVVLAGDKVRAAQIEIHVKEELSRSGVLADSLRVIAKDPENTRQLTELLQSQSYDSLMCMGPSKTIRVTSSDKAGGFTTMQNCLSIYLTGNYPTGEPLDVDPVSAEEPPPATHPASTPARTPIPTNPTAVPMTVFKGTLRVFDTGSSQVIWEGSLAGRAGKDLNTSVESKVIAKSVLSALKKSGLLPE